MSNGSVEPSSRPVAPCWRVVRAACRELPSLAARTLRALRDATARSVRIRLISGNPIKIGAVQSTATETCVAKGGKLSLKRTGKSTVAYIVINGQKTTVGNKYEKITVGPPATPLATIYLNRTIKKSNTLTQRAVEIDVGGTKPSVILAQSEVDSTGNPCATA